MVFLFVFTKTFHLVDSHYPIELYEKRFIDYDPYFSATGSLTKPLKEKRINGLINESKWETKHYNRQGQLEFSAQYNLSKIKSRINLFQKEAQKHFIIAGDSQVFGIGVNDENVLTNFLNQNSRAINYYNLGYPGWSAASTFALINPENKVKIKNLINEDEGHFIYILYPYLMDRDRGSVDTIAFTNGHLTYLQQDGNKLKTMGVFKDSDDFVINLKKLLAFLGLDGFYRDILLSTFYRGYDEYNLENYKFTSLIFKNMQEAYKSHFPKGKFSVVICENYSNSEEEKNNLIDQLLERNIKVYDFTPYTVCNSDKLYFSDNHLTPEGHRELATLIQQNILR